MSVKTQNRKTLNFTTIHKRISEQGKTISELAPEYSMTEEAFIQEMRSGLGPKVFSALKKMSEKNEKARERLKSSAEKKRKNSQKLLEKKLQPGESVLENTDVSPEKEMKQLLSQKNSVEKQIQNWDNAIANCLRNKEEKQQEISNLIEALNAIKEKLATTKSELESKENEYQNSINEKSKLENKLSGISEQIEVLEQSHIYLVAPGYHGKKPNFGRFISTEEIDGMNIEIQKGELLINDESLDNMMLCGYYDVREYMRALEFAKLCIVHIVECDHYEILVDDERISKVLTTQGIEVKL